MTRVALLTAYAGLFCWLAYCAAASALHGGWWQTAVFVLAAPVPLVAASREGLLAEALRREAVRAERGARLAAHNGPPLTAVERAAWQRLAAALEGPEDTRGAA
ncbi:hypothetical protein [Streptomyces mangrovisoli]|uniref:Uncharacterized protein n=1 Tax=Streptomyces mangrovisoli TaxID=1428628 RepID=A0A1J4P1G2_9ACTN|nr:hypothetical protein [Streptomyces mangrovisoli]OIJ68583.1 hypothetical protein WN71_007290 [Streptomyces mangrovisoli]